MGASTLEQIINYVTAGNFTFDSTLLEFSGSAVRLKDLRPANATFHSKFETKDANWGDGVLTGTLNNSATVSSGVLNLPSGAAARNMINWGGASNTPSGNTGCVRFTFTPNYTGAPSSSRHIFVMSAAESDIDNMVRIQHIGTNLRIDLYNSTGTSILTSQTGNTFSPVAGTPYEIELNWDVTAGEIRLFINGALINGTQAGTGTMGARTLLRMGNDYTSSSSDGLDGTIDDLIIFDAVQHTAAYTHFATIPYQYSKDSPSVLNNSGVTADALDDFEETTATKPTDTSIKYVINVSGVDKYWDGSAWSNSDGTVAQSNTVAEITTNKAALDLSTGATIKIKAFLTSDDGDARPELETVTVSYNFFNTQPQPATCTVWGFYRDVAGNGVASATVTIEIKRSSKQYREADDAIIEKKVTLTTDSNGRFESDLVRSSSYETGGTYILKIKKTADSLETSRLSTQGIEFTVPDAVDKNITDLITAAA